MIKYNYRKEKLSGRQHQKLTYENINIGHNYGHRDASVKNVISLV